MPWQSEQKTERIAAVRPALPPGDSFRSNSSSCCRLLGAMHLRAMEGWRRPIVSGRCFHFDHQRDSQFLCDRHWKRDAVMEARPSYRSAFFHVSVGNTERHQHADLGDGTTECWSEWRGQGLGRHEQSSALFHPRPDALHAEAVGSSNSRKGRPARTAQKIGGLRDRRWREHVLISASSSATGRLLQVAP